MDWEMVLDIGSMVLMVLFGGLALWFRGNQVLAGRAAALIAEAEALYQDATKAGGEKFEWVVSALYAALPAVIRPFLSRGLVESVVQATFDAVEGYARLQLDKLAGGTADDRN